MISFSQLENITGGKTLRQKSDDVITMLAIDSRKVVRTEGTLFFAIHGARHDGHRYLAQLYKKGVRSFVVETPPLPGEMPDANVLVVPGTVEALQKIAAHHRAQFSIPVVGITGSNGKTIIKEWLYQMLSKSKAVVKNPGSYNSQVGVPLSVWQIQQHHQVGIFEAGISQPGEMAKLAEVIKPSVGIFANIGSAHDQGFANRGEKIAEKIKLFQYAQCVIYCRDHEQIHIAMHQAGVKAFTWGTQPDADVVVTRQPGAFQVAYQGLRFTLYMPFADKASVENCFHVVALLLFWAYDVAFIQEAILGLHAVPMRLELKEGINHCQIIDDTYNNDLGGLEISLQFLTHQHQRAHKRVILSDILESGMAPAQLARTVGELLHQNGVRRFVGIGSQMAAYRQYFPADALFFETTQQFLHHFKSDLLHDEVILVKGARAFEFERVVHYLQRKVHGTVMEIDLGALVHNLNYFRSLLRPATKIMVMVKAFAYGSGSNEIANLLQYHRVDYLGVAYADEGVELRKGNISLPIMVMNPSEDSFALLQQYQLEPEVYSFKILQALVNFLAGKRCRVHVKLDTGMHRLGFEEHDLERLIAQLKAHPNIEVASIFSHLAGADESAHDAFSYAQATKFRDMAERLAQTLGYRPVFHLLNSPGILRMPAWQFDMVRLGIGLYGVDPTSEGYDELRPVATLKTIISQIREVPANETIGYGRSGVADKNMRLGTIAVGYADGFSRAFSRCTGQVLVRGHLAKVVGNVCMDMTMIDLTGVPAEEGDEVILFGGDLPIQRVAASINTIPYEILTNTSERVKRVFIAESI